MREIKFRGYDIELEEMTYFDSDDYILQYGDILREFIDDYDGFGNPEFSYESVKDKVELMQYTGLKDKNGKEIYEGDIVEIIRPCILERGEVKFINGCFAIKSKDTLLMLYQCEINNFKLKVIGNIYDNPELLKEEI